MQWTIASRKISKLRKRIRIVQGGTSAGKTYSILQLLIFYCLNHPYHVSIVSESIPHLRRGALKDFIKLLSENNIYEDSRFNRSTLTYTFPNGAIIEFFSADQPDKLRGARRDILFINECNNIEYDAFVQMEVRTRQFIYLDFNPTHEFWVHDQVIPNNPDHDFIKVSYKDNEQLGEEIIKSIESKKNNAWWWTVYGLGEIGKLEDSIFPNWSEGGFDISLPFCFGIDFGFSPDPTALVKTAVDNKRKKIYVKELCYSQKLTEENIIQVLSANTDKRDMIVADCADSRLIDAIFDNGFNIMPASKGAGSIREGILYIQDFELIVDKDSHNLKKELNNYCWNDKRAGVPIDRYNHCIDALRYSMERLREPSFFFS